MTYSQPRGWVEGFNARGIDWVRGDPATWLPLVSGVVLELYHCDAYGEGNGLHYSLASGFDPVWVAQMNDHLSWLSTPANYSLLSGQPLKVVLRPRGGPWMHGEAKSFVGGAVRYAFHKGWGDPVQATRKGAAIPAGPGVPAGTYEFIGGMFPYWAGANADAVWRKWVSDIMALFGDHPLVLEFDLAKSAQTPFQEPMINASFQIQRNLDDFIAAGWTPDKHLQAFRDSFDDALSLVCLPHGLGCSTAYSPRGVVTIGTGGAPNTWVSNAAQGTQDAIDMAAFMQAKLGRFAIPGNKSFDPSYTTADRAHPKSNEIKIWDAITGPPDRTNVGLPCQVFWQSATTQVMDAASQTVKQLIDSAILSGAMRLEVPNGMQNASRGADQITPSYAATYSPQLRFNPAKMPRTPLRVGVVKGATPASNAPTVTATLPGSIPDGSVLFLTSLAQTDSLATLTGTVQAPVVVRFDGGGTSIPTYLWAVRVGALDSGQTITASYTAPTTGSPLNVLASLIGEVWSNVSMPAAAHVAYSQTTVTPDGSGNGNLTMGTLARPGDLLIEFGMARLSDASVATTVTLPGTLSASDLVYTPKTTGGRSLSVVGDTTGVGGGNIVSSPGTPAPQRLVSYAVAVYGLVSVSSDNVAFWDDLKTIAPRTRSATWDVTSRVTSTRATSWEVRSPVTRTAAARFDTLAQVTGSKAATWDTLVKAFRARGTTWATLVSVAGASTRSTTWDTRLAVTATRLTRWDALLGITAQRSTSWTTGDAPGTLASVTQSKGTTWDTRVLVTRARGTTWDIAQAITSSRPTSWDTLVYVLPMLRSTTWDVGGSILSTRSTSWTVAQTVASARSTSWEVRSGILVPHQAVATWDDLVTAEATRDATWDSLASLTTRADAVWADLPTPAQLPPHFTLTCDLNVIDGRPTKTTRLTITPMVADDLSLTDSDGRRIYDGSVVELRGGRLIDPVTGKDGVTLPDSSVFPGGTYRVTRSYAGGTAEWFVPAQGPAVLFDLADAEQSVPASVPPTVSSRVAALEAQVTQLLSLIGH